MGRKLPKMLDWGRNLGNTFIVIEQILEMSEDDDGVKREYVYLLPSSRVDEIIKLLKSNLEHMKVIVEMLENRAT